jgi:hypothetical protein
MNFFTTALIRILEGMFLVGVAGSAVVLVLATIEDIRTMLDRDDYKESEQLDEAHVPAARQQPTFHEPRPPERTL